MLQFCSRFCHENEFKITRCNQNLCYGLQPLSLVVFIFHVWIDNVSSQERWNLIAMQISMKELFFWFEYIAKTKLIFVLKIQKFQILSKITKISDSVKNRKNNNWKGTLVGSTTKTNLAKWNWHLSGNDSFKLKTNQLKFESDSDSLTSKSALTL